MWGQSQGFNQGQVQPSPVFGGTGGNPGELSNPNYSLIAVRGRHGGAVDSLQFLFVDITTGQCVESPVLGGQGGVPFEFSAPQGQWIDKISLKYHSIITSITFQTNLGVSSGKVGAGGGNGKEETLNLAGKRITGVKWRSGTLIDSLQFFYSS